MAARIEKTVFISYRRSNFWAALAIFQNLHQNGYDVFFDYKSIPSGDFEQVITEAVKSRAHFIVILSPSALDRCYEPNDWLRREIELALDHKRNIIPLTMEGFDFGSPSTVNALKGKLAKLKKYNAMGIPAEYFDEAMVKLRSEKFLNRPLESVAHPVSEVTKRITAVQKNAASAAEPVEKDKLTAQEWLERGYAFASTGNLEEATRCLTESIRLNPTHKAYYNRGIILRSWGDFEDAIQDYDSAIAIDPKVAQAYNNRGNVRRDKGDLDGAISDYDKALSLKQDAFLAYINRGIARTARGEIDAALADFNEALSHLTTLQERAEAFYRRGTLFQLQGHLGSAVNDFQKAIDLDVYHFLARASLCDILQKTGFDDEAAEHEKAARFFLMRELEYNQACFESIIGNVDSALRLLESAFRQKQSTKLWARNDPDLANIHNDPRFKELVGE